MPTYQIVPTPTDGYPDSKYGVSLNGQTFVFHYVWSERYQRWTLSILDQDETPLAEGLVIEANWDVIHDVHLPQLDGHLLAQDVTGRGEPPGLTELGKRVRLVFYQP